MAQRLAMKTLRWTCLLRGLVPINAPFPGKHQSLRAQIQPSVGGTDRHKTSIAHARGDEDSTLPVTKQVQTVKHLGSNLAANLQARERPDALLTRGHPAAEILEHPVVVVQRQVEMMNIFLGFEQANRYIIMSPDGEQIGYMAEQGDGIGKTMGRQMLRTHRAFTTHIFNKERQEVLRLHRPFSLINSRIRVYDPVAPGSSQALRNTASASSAAQTSPLSLSDMRIIGEAQSEWAPFRRKYHLYVSQPSGALEPPVSARGPGGQVAMQGQVTMSPSESVQEQYVQFAHIDEQFLSWDFSLRSESDRIIGSVNRNFAGFAHEIFTDTGVYALRMNAAGSENETTEANSTSHTDTRDLEPEGGVSPDRKIDDLGMTYDQRAVMLATAVTVDYDYFSRHSHGSGMGMMPLWMGGGEAAEGGAAAGGAGEMTSGTVAGEAERAVGGAVSGTSRVGEGAAAGAGTMAGYEALQKGGSEHGPPDESSLNEQTPQQTSGHGEEDVWGSKEDPWNSQNQPPPGGSGSTDGGDGGGSFWDIFSDE